MDEDVDSDGCAKVDERAWKGFEERLHCIEGQIDPRMVWLHGVYHQISNYEYKFHNVNDGGTFI